VCNPFEYDFSYISLTADNVILEVHRFLSRVHFPAKHIVCFPATVVNYKSNFPVLQGRTRIRQTITSYSNKGSETQLQSVPKYMSLIDETCAHLLLSDFSSCIIEFKIRLTVSFF